MPDHAACNDSADTPGAETQRTVLHRQHYGKAHVRVLRVQRRAHSHEVHEVRVRVTLEGEFARAYTDGDNASIVATDSMKNIVQMLALEHLPDANELFALAIARCLLERYAHVARAQVEIEETPWTRMHIDGQPQAHSFLRAEGGIPYARITLARTGRDIISGIRDFPIMKTTQSGFTGYIQDDCTTLPETGDRILATRLQATWHLAGPDTDFRATAATVRSVLLRVFATTYSASVQDSLYRMGDAVLAAVPDITEITLAMPNVHYLPIDLTPLGLETDNRLFLPTDEPHGHIEAALRRA